MHEVPFQKIELECTETQYLPFKDQNGVEHVHDENNISVMFTCPHEHQITMENIGSPTCPAKCGFGSEYVDYILSLVTSC